MTEKHGEPILTETPNIIQDQIARLRQLFPEAFTEGHIDWEKLRATLGEHVDDAPERYTFTWTGKRDAIRLLQTPTRATLVPCRAESVRFDETQHVFIEGDNLEVLKLLYKPYFGRVKMIYIDPPYNTGNDFVYPDNYADPLATYLQLTGQQDANGNLLTSNPETSGRYHSTWLSMMYPRLFLARQLLRDDGVIFVSIDDHEVHNLRLLMNEVFGEENLIVILIWHRRQVPDNRNINNVSTDHEYVLAYEKGAAVFTGTPKDLSKYSNPDNDPRGSWMSDNMTGLANAEERPNLHYDLVDPETKRRYPPHLSRGWIYGKTRMQQLIADGRILWPANPNGRPRLKRFLSELRSKYTGFSSILDVGYTTQGTRELADIFGEKLIAFPKPASLLKTLLEQVTSPKSNDIIVDFFAGSATTAQAILELNHKDDGNRHFVMVQLPEKLPNPKMYDDNTKLVTLADVGKERIRRVIAKMQQEQEGQLPLTTRETPEDLGFKAFKLAPSNYRSWPGVDDDTPTAYEQQMTLFTDPLVDGWTAEDVIYEVALKEGYGLNCRIELVGAHPRVRPGLESGVHPQPGQTRGFAPTDTGITIYRVTDLDREQSFLICLDGRVNLSDLRHLNLSQDDVFVCRDAALDDDTAANLALQCRLKTI
ncbi:MAG: site-specific DNA-methyltransferase [Chloroflexi bacterium]|nr:site-specific DNA-methyltransferase [Chloroflexota bacterium]